MAVSGPLPHPTKKLENSTAGRFGRGTTRTVRTLVGTLANAALVAVLVVVVTFFLTRGLLGDPAYTYAMGQNGEERRRAPRRSTLLASNWESTRRSCTSSGST